MYFFRFLEKRNSKTKVQRKHHLGKHMEGAYQYKEYKNLHGTFHAQYSEQKKFI